MSEQRVARGLDGVIVDDTAVCHIDGDRGELLYRGYSIADLAGVASFEEVAHLLWLGELPGREDLRATRDALRSSRVLPPGVLDLLRGLPRVAKPMDVARTLASVHGSFVPAQVIGGEGGELRGAIHLCGFLLAGVAAFHRVRQQLPVLEQRPDLDHAANFLWLALGEVPGRDAARAFDTALVLHAEHGFNASTFAARVAASTLADLDAAVTAAIATLSGSLHGGANQRVMEMLLAIGTPARAAAWARERLASKQKVMGFGHRVYRTADPRAVVLKRLSEKLTRARGIPGLYDISCILEVEVEKALGDRGIAPNVDFWSASLYHALGLPGDLFTPVFALSRVVGWSAHVLEQRIDNRLIRPSATYRGPGRRAMVPLMERAGGGRTG